MAFTYQTPAPNLSLFGRIVQSVQAAREAFDRYSVYRKTLNELATLSGRELADLGLNRSMLKRIALDAAYGENVR